jgi:hypothetical protein
LALSLSAGVGPAKAAGEVYCAIRDSNLDVKLALRTTVGRGEGVVPTSLQGSLEVFHQKQNRERRSWSLDGRAIAQYWATGGRLNLRLFMETDENSVELIIETRGRANSDSDFAGDYGFRSSDGVRVSGRVECQRG